MSATIQAWQTGKSVTARWGKREVVVPEFKTLFAEIQEVGGIGSATLVDGVWQVVVNGCNDILSKVFEEADEPDECRSSRNYPQTH